MDAILTLLNQIQNDINMLKGKRIFQQDIIPGAIKPRHLVIDKTPHKGDLYYSDGTNFIKIPIGTNGQVLTIVSGVPTWV